MKHFCDITLLKQIPNILLYYRYHKKKLNNNIKWNVKEFTLKTKKRSSTILPFFEKCIFRVYNGKTYINVYITKNHFFFKLGEFDERFIYAAMEDVELRYRIKMDGNSYLFIPMASICHPWRRIKGWDIHKKRILSTKLFLTIHPEENKRLNGKHFFIVFCRNVLKGTIVGLWTFKGRGLVGEIVKNFSFLYQAVYLGLKMKKE